MTADRIIREISCQLDLIELTRLTYKTGVNVYDISTCIKLKTDIVEYCLLEGRGNDAGRVNNV